MDIKIKGLPYEILRKALNQSKNGRLHIFDKMLEEMPKLEKNSKPHSPKMYNYDCPQRHDWWNNWTWRKDNSKNAN